mgnify:CR=1 FL=1
MLNLARDHNRRGLVSIRHHLPAGRDTDVQADASDQLVRDEQHGLVIDAVRRLPTRQRGCIVLRFFEERSIEQLAATLIFTAFILFTVTFEEPADRVDSTGAQLEHEVARIGGILLIMGVLHAANVAT